MKYLGLLSNLYVFNFGLLFTHQIEGAYWREWEMFGIPVGITEYLILHFILLVGALYGYRLLLNRSRVGFVFSFLLAFTGIVAFPIHAFYVLGGHEEFTLAISWILLGTALAVSIIQAFLTYRVWQSSG
ncbi:MAG: hypothetical protein IBX61_08115 [Thermoleophilia bacterium]|nr:hypothetical protein [Thermoleophilia bacterium]